MAIQQHPLAAANLGELVSHTVFNAAPVGEPADWQVAFDYENGSVNMRVENNNYKYNTFMTDELLEGQAAKL